MSSKTKQLQMHAIQSDLCSATHHKMPVEVFAALADQAWSIWLDSCCDVQTVLHPDSRYDVIVWQPTFTITTRGDISEVLNHQLAPTEAKYCQHFADDPLTLLEQFQHQVFTDYTLQQTELSRFIGALGYFGYDLGRRFERMPAIAENDIKLPDMAVGIYRHALVFDHVDQRWQLICPEQNRAQLEQWLSTILANNITLKPAQKPFTLTTSWQANMSEQQYHQKFAEVQQYLLSGDCYQINLAQRFKAAYQGNEFNAYLALRNANQAPFSAFIRIDDACILSISPERFLQVQQGGTQSKPIKGTAPRAKNNIDDQQLAKELQQSAKNRAENVMIVDLLRNDMSKVCQAGSVKVTELFAIESFPAVHHLVSTIVGQLAVNKSAVDLLRGAFPGGSITGAPKIRAMQIIEQLEPHRRSVYCGSIGYIGANGDMDTNITIRTLVCHQQQIYAWAGGGLVADSIAELEYQETYHKVDKILPILSGLSS